MIRVFIMKAAGKDFLAASEESISDRRKKEAGGP